MSFQIQSLSAEDTLNIGRLLGRVLRGGDVLCLNGDLGAGKTALAKGIGEALTVAEPMTSPTFTYMHEYNGIAQGQPVRLIHMDLYRLQHAEEVEAIGVEDAFQNDTICLIEWPEIAEDYLPNERLELRIDGSGEEARTLSFFPFSQNWQERILNLREILSAHR